MKLADHVILQNLSPPRLYPAATSRLCSSHRSAAKLHSHTGVYSYKYKVAFKAIQPAKDLSAGARPWTDSVNIYIILTPRRPALTGRARDVIKMAVTAVCNVTLVQLGI